MSERFRKRFGRISTIRDQWWDYSHNGLYFITINAHNKTRYFGEIVKGEMQRSNIGELAYQLLNEISLHYDWALLDEFVIMPDHIHAIIAIQKSDPESELGVALLHSPVIMLPPNEEINGGCTGVKNPMFYDNLSRVVRWFKGRMTFECRKINPEFEWQRGFDDEVIQSREEYFRIARYIRDNPTKWEE
jgi:REP element-mobilizing transposase RayT